MRRGFVVLVVSILAMAAVIPAQGRESAGKKKKRVERVEEKPYVGGMGLAGQTQSECLEDGVACATFPIEKGERYVALEITDVTGQPVYASVYIYGYTDGTDSHEHICAKSEQPFAMQPGLEELVVVPSSSAGGTSPDCTGLVVQGTVTATFSNLP